MREDGTTPTDSAARLTRGVPWIVSDVRALPDYRLAVGFVDGTRGEVDMGALIHGDRAGVFAGLRDPDAFARAYVDCGAVSWPGNIDLAPDAMYEAIRARGRWTPK